MNVFELVAKLTLNTEEYEAALAKAKSSEAQEGIKKGFAATAAAGVAALGALAVSSVKTGAEFDKSMSQVAATLGLSMDELQTQVGTTETSFGHFEGTLRDFARFMGENTAFSASQAADALNYMALAGYDAQKSMDMLPTVLNLAAAGNMDLAQASDMVTDAASALGLGVKETTEMVDQMAMASSKGNTSVAQLGEAMLTIGATARDVSGGTNELATMLTVLADNSIKGAEGGTHLRNIMLSLQEQTKDGAEALQKLNMTYDDFYDASGNLRSLPEIFTQLSEKMDGMTQKSKAAIVNGIFNKTDLAAVNALLNTSSDRFEQLAKDIDESAGAAQRMADTQLDNLAGDVTQLQSAFSEFQIKIHDQLNPTLRTVVQGVTELIKNFDTIAPVLAGVATAFGVFTVAINIKNIVSGVTTAFTAFNAVLAANPIGIVVALLAGLAVALVTLWNNNEEFRNKVTAAWESIKEAWSNAVEKIKAAGEELKQDWENIKQSASQLGENIKQVWENIKQSISNVVQQAVQWGSNLISNISNGIQNGISNISSAVQNIGSTIKSGLQGIISNALSWGKDLMSNFINGIKSKIGELGSAISNVAQKAANIIGFSEPKEGPLSNFHTYAPDMMQLFAKGITDNADLVQNAFNKSLSLNTPVLSASGTSGSAGGFAAQSREIVFNVTELIDGSVLARNQYRFNLDEADRHGANLINAYA